MYDNIFYITLQEVNIVTLFYIKKWKKGVFRNSKCRALFSHKYSIYYI